LAQIDPLACNIIPSEILDGFGQVDWGCNDLHIKRSEENIVCILGGGCKDGRPCFVSRNYIITGIWNGEHIHIPTQGVGAIGVSGGYCILFKCNITVEEIVRGIYGVSKISG